MTCVAGPVERGDRGVVADRHEAAVADRHRLGDAPVAVDRDDAAAAQDEIGGLRVGYGGRENEAEGRGNERQTQAVEHGGNSGNGYDCGEGYPRGLGVDGEIIVHLTVSRRDLR